MIIGLIVFGMYLYFFIGIHQILLVLKNLNSVQYAFFYSFALLGVLVFSIFLVSSLEYDTEKSFNPHFL